MDQLKFYFLSLFLIFSYLATVNCQIWQSDPVGTMKKANSALNQGQFKLADSLYTSIINHSINGDIYFNRAQARLNLKDSCGYCNDLESAYTIFNDKEAKKLFFEDCERNWDTTYFTDNGIQEIKNENYRFYKIKKQSTCEKIVIIELHDKKTKLNILPANIIGFTKAVNRKPVITDLVGISYLKDGIEIYSFYYPYSMNKLLDDQITEYKRNLISFLNKKYPNVKKEKDREAQILLRILLNKNGKIEEVTLAKTYNLNFNLEDQSELEAGLRKAFQGLSALKPLRIMNSPVNYESIYELEL